MKIDPAKKYEFKAKRLNDVTEIVEVGLNGRGRPAVRFRDRKTGYVASMPDCYNDDGVYLPNDEYSLVPSKIDLSKVPKGSEMLVRVRFMREYESGDVCAYAVRDGRGSITVAPEEIVSVTIPPAAPREIKIGDQVRYKDDHCDTAEVVGIHGDALWLKDADGDFDVDDADAWEHAA